MVTAYRLTKEKQYPLPHDINCQYVLGGKSSSTGYCTIMPYLHHDEARLPSNVYTHPEHASFAETDYTGISAESKVFKMIAATRISLTKQAVGTDNVQALRVGIMDIHGAFEDFDATDELTGVSVGDVLELTKETVDRQTYPIYDGTDLTPKYTGSSTLNTNAQGLTTDTKIENVAFDPDLFYDALNYYTISEKLKNCQSGLRWFTLTQNNPTRTFFSRLDSGNKASNPYNFAGQLVYLPRGDTRYQIYRDGDVTATVHLLVEHRIRYLEWNDNFHHERA